MLILCFYAFWRTQIPLLVYSLNDCQNLPNNNLLPYINNFLEYTSSLVFVFKHNVPSHSHNDVWTGIVTWMLPCCLLMLCL